MTDRDDTAPTAPMPAGTGAAPTAEMRPAAGGPARGDESAATARTAPAAAATPRPEPASVAAGSPRRPPAASGELPLPPASHARRRAAKPAAWPVIAGTAGVFFAALAFLAGEVRDGRDPVLGPAEAATPEPSQPRQIVVRRIVRRVVIHHPAPKPAAPVATGGGGAAPAPVASSGSGGGAPAPVPPPAAAAPAAAPAPAGPPPTPLTTQSS